jgi:hypothetical protein
VSIDSVLLDLAERTCRRFQMATGRTNVWLAVQLTNLSIVLYFIWAGVYSWSGGLAPRWAVALFCAVLLYVLTQTIFKESIEAYENAAYRRVAKGFRNPRRIRDAQLRISFLSLSVLLGYPVVFVYVTLHLRLALLTYALILLTTAVLYLLACDPLPPCLGSIREWLQARKLVHARSEHGSVAFGDERAVAAAGVAPRQTRHPGQLARHGASRAGEKAARDLAQRGVAARPPAKGFGEASDAERP